MSDGELKIIGYIAGWQNWTAEKTDISKLTHLNYAFAHITDGLITIQENNKLEELRKLKQNNPKVKFLISVGGWGAEGFSDAALTELSRDRFSDSVVEFIKANGFDGVDLDWEYPCSSEAGIKSRPEDKLNFTLLLQAIKRKLEIERKNNDREYLLTIATGAMQEQADSLELDKLAQIVDFINVMTYDFHNGLSSISGHQANLFTSICDDGDRMSVDKAINTHISAGVPASMLNLGFPFYGRGWKVSEAENKGVFDFSGGECKEFSYTSILTEYIDKNNFKRYWDESAKAAYLWNGSFFITYEDAASIRYKTDYIKAKGLGGAMFWEYSQDEGEILLSKLYNDLRGR